MKRLTRGLWCVCEFVSFYINIFLTWIIVVLIVIFVYIPVCVRVCVSSKMMDVCGEAESRLATELMQHEVLIERDVLDPLNHLAEVKKTDAAALFIL